MRFKSFWISIFLTPILSFIIWLFNVHYFTDYINIIFYVSLIIFIVMFIILITQEGIFDATSYGFRRLKYQLSSNKKKKAIEDDDFFNPRYAKKDHYMISSWVISSMLINLIYCVLAIVISFLI